MVSNMLLFTRFDSPSSQKEQSMHTLLVVLNDGRKITVSGFENTEEMVRFSSAIDPELFEFNNITFEPVETATAE